MKKKVTVKLDLEVLEDITRALMIMLEVASNYDLTDEDIDRMKYVNKLIESSNEMFEKSVKSDDNE
jgi:hypothetical protein